jgi:hypothetical protein
MHIWNKIHIDSFICSMTFLLFDPSSCFNLLQASITKVSSILCFHISTARDLLMSVAHASEPINTRGGAHYEDTQQHTSHTSSLSYPSSRLTLEA